jgi:hypothetical protein
MPWRGVRAGDGGGEMMGGSVVGVVAGGTMTTGGE